MIGLDTNVLVRYITQDDKKQSAIANRLIESLTVEVPGYISLVSVIELVWVLSACYGSNKAELCGVLEALLHTRELVVAEGEVVWKAIRLFKSSAAEDFADCLIVCSANAAGCESVFTFDKNAAKYAGMRLAS